MPALRALRRSRVPGLIAFADNVPVLSNVVQAFGSALQANARCRAFAKNRFCRRATPTRATRAGGVEGSACCSSIRSMTTSSPTTRGPRRRCWKPRATTVHFNARQGRAAGVLRPHVPRPQGLVDEAKQEARRMLDSVQAVRGARRADCRAGAVVLLTVARRVPSIRFRRRGARAREAGVFLRGVPRARATGRGASQLALQAFG